MIPWREKFRAFGIHFLATAALGALAAALIFLVWFPHPLATLVGGTGLFLLVVGIDLALGPLVSLVIYDSRKTRRALIFDYTLVGVVQIAAMVYGVYIVAGTRPVYVAFSGDRFEIVTARDISDAERARASDPRYAKLPLDGPRFIAVEVPRADREDALFQALAGNEEHQRPKFYQPFESGLAAIRAKAGTVDELVGRLPETRGAFAAATRDIGIPPDRLRWLPVRYREKFWTALIDTQTGLPVRYVPIDSYGDE